MTDETNTNAEDTSGVDAQEQDQQQEQQFTNDDFLALRAKNEELEKSIQSVLSKNSELKGEKIKAQDKIREAEEKRALEEAKQSEDQGKFEATIRSQERAAFDREKEAWTEERNELNDIVLGGASRTAVSKLAGLFNDVELGEDLLKNMIKSEISDKNVVTTLTDRKTGERITTDLKEMEKFLKNNKFYKPYLKGVESSGMADTKGSPSKTGAQGKDPKKMSSQERIEWKQRDPVGFANHFNLKH